MKKIISTLLICGLLSTSCVNVFAADFQTSNQIEQSTVIAKQRLDIKESNNFKSSVYSEEDGLINKDIYRLNWELEDCYINVNIGEDNVIREYNKNSKENENPHSTLFTVYKTEAVNTAKDFIKKINPDIYSEYEFKDIERARYIFGFRDIMSDLGGDEYIATFERKVNGITYKDDTMKVYISGFTGEVTRYDCSYHKNISFDSFENKITLEETKRKFKDNLNIELNYKIKNNYEKQEDGTYKNVPTTMIVYSDNTKKQYLNANTNTLYTSNPRYIGYEYYDYALDTNSSAVGQKENSMADNYSLTDTERKEISDTKDVKSVEEIFQIVKDTKYFAISDTAKVKDFHLYKENNKKTYEINIEDDDKNNSFISVDANSGIVNSFNLYNRNYSDKNKTSKLSVAKDFVNNYLKLSDETIVPQDNETNDFVFYRKVNNIPCYDNRVYISIDEKTGLIDSYNKNWTENIEFVSTNGIISKDEAKEIFINNFDYELFYYVDTDINETSIENYRQAILAYNYENNKTSYLDAKTKEFLDYGLNKYAPNRFKTTFKVASKYTDISGHWAENIIKIMQNNNIGTISEEFKPDANITYKDLFELFGLELTEKDFLDFKDYVLERNLKGLTFVKDITLDTTITREEFCALMVVVGNYNYDKIIDKSDFYKLDYSDKDLISENKKGYIAIAKMLNYLSGNTFRPQDKITRAEAITFLYNIYSNLY